MSLEHCTPLLRPVVIISETEHSINRGEVSEIVTKCLFSELDSCSGLPVSHRASKKPAHRQSACSDSHARKCTKIQQAAFVCGLKTKSCKRTRTSAWNNPPTENSWDQSVLHLPALKPKNVSKSTKKNARPWIFQRPALRTNGGGLFPEIISISTNILSDSWIYSSFFKCYCNFLK
jgi:hypothetical protein